MTRPLRIALLTHSTNPRGGVSHCLSLAEALTDLGHDAVVHAPDPAGRGFYREARCGTVAVPACRVESRSTADMVEQRISEYWDWFRVPSNRVFDVFHAHDGIGGNALADLTDAGLIRGFLRTVHHLDRFADQRVEARQTRAVGAAETVLCVSDLWADDTEARLRHHGPSRPQRRRHGNFFASSGRVRSRCADAMGNWPRTHLSVRRRVRTAQEQPEPDRGFRGRSGAA